ncbi:hypothetical protein C8N40_110122 [Pontibacter mucosus]|uniref:MAE-28990/MAE-18760-like HEPN domain-containing protein n=1 Tax=Pontibacter mucosus TaxID=1649266 RepID=A0A2T5YDR3_9BACT|nr:MAE_28990/MAE_18760 family HEPN-like nuclease [Pontibacter mucosus]PTX14693.1 hypothetical protein C8N40_110122 [Pontibacter mucosus]
MKYQQFENLLDEDLGWRKKEISDLLLIAKKESNNEVVLKSLILLLYAHWEGYIKLSSKLYIKYVSDKNINVGVLSSNFKAISIKEYISRCIENNGSMTLANEMAFMSKYLKLETRKFQANVRIEDDFDSSIINTESNLKPKVLRNITSILGLGYKSAVQTREHYLNSQLLANRNAIGHGSKFDDTKQVDFSLSLRDIEKLKEIVFAIIDSFRDDLLDYVANEYYLSTNLTAKEAFNAKREVDLEKVFTIIEEKYKI